MGDWPTLSDGGPKSAYGLVTGTTTITTLLAPATPNTKATNFTELVSSTPYSSYLLGIVIYAGGNYDFLADIAIGAASSEVVIINNLIVSTYGQGPTHIYWFPIFIPAGIRISAKIQSSGANQSIKMAICLGAKGFIPSAPYSRVNTYGAITNDSGGTEINCNGQNAKGPYSEIVAATTNPIKHLIVGIGLQGVAHTSLTSYYTDIAIGPDIELVIIPNIFMRHYGTFNPVPQAFNVDIPAGTRIAARGQCSSAIIADQKYDIILYGVD